MKLIFLFKTSQFCLITFVIIDNGGLVFELKYLLEEEEHEGGFADAGVPHQQAFELLGVRLTAACIGDAKIAERRGDHARLWQITLGYKLLIELGEFVVFAAFACFLRLALATARNLRPLTWYLLGGRLFSTQFFCICCAGDCGGGGWGHFANGRRQLEFLLGFLFPERRVRWEGRKKRRWWWGGGGGGPRRGPGARLVNGWDGFGGGGERGHGGRVAAPVFLVVGMREPMRLEAPRLVIHVVQQIFTATETLQPQLDITADFVYGECLIVAVFIAAWVDQTGGVIYFCMFTEHGGRVGLVVIEKLAAGAVRKHEVVYYYERRWLDQIVYIHAVEHGIARHAVQTWHPRLIGEHVLQASRVLCQVAGVPHTCQTVQNTDGHSQSDSNWVQTVLISYVLFLADKFIQLILNLARISSLFFLYYFVYYYYYYF